ncbi:short-chain dehydrogenase [Ophiocordyceps sinensis CO18]|uniref:Short-chain dehydrogenase n=1 Tax=Ophiocordyceps sinensis (strain Co18 / CGMCC 3.14243) TaxID=911162 RepID=T4ZW77_OPHSC|nr:short-chain dehydrogenase [Ophiocordyceps sinensis CO18]
MIGETGMIPTPKSRTWTSTDNLDELRATDPGLAIAAGVPEHRLGVPDEVANVVAMYACRLGPIFRPLVPLPLLTPWRPRRFAKTGYMTGQEVLLAGGLR